MTGPLPPPSEPFVRDRAPRPDPSGNGTARASNMGRPIPLFSLLLAALLIAATVCSISSAFDLNLLPEEQEEELDMEMMDQQQQQQPPPPPSGMTTAASASLAPSWSPTPEVIRTDERNPEQAPAGKGSWWDTVKRVTSGTVAQLPEWFSFKKYSAQFKRHYSQAEAVLRKSIFFERCLQIFKSRVAFRLGRKSYTESVNKFSDRSPNEFEQMFMSGPPIELRPPGQSEHDYYEQLRQNAYEKSRWGEEDRELFSKASLGDDGSSDDGDSVTILNEAQAKRQIDLMLENQSFDEQMQIAILEEMMGAAGHEGFSQAEAGGGSSSSTGAGHLEPQRRPLPWPGKSLPPQEREDAQSSFERRPYAEPAIGPHDRIDWSEHQCFHKIYDQGIKCGKCYVMAATSLAEFYKCSERINEINRRQFSKDYVLDCGQKFSATILGCTGGSLLDTLQFIAKAGVHNIKGWRSLRNTKIMELNLQGIPIGPLDQKCPLNRLDTPIESWGNITIGIKPVQVDANHWLEALADGPLAVSVQLPSEGLQSYAGGVHDGSGCANSGHWHSMVLVGYGVSERDGLAYWRFRNSWGEGWGDNGHFNMAMSVQGECLAGGVRLYRNSELSD